MVLLNGWRCWSKLEQTGDVVVLLLYWLLVAGSIWNSWMSTVRAAWSLLVMGQGPTTAGVACMPRIRIPTVERNPCRYSKF